MKRARSTPPADGAFLHAFTGQGAATAKQSVGPSPKHAVLAQPLAFTGQHSRSGAAYLGYEKFSFTDSDQTPTQQAPGWNVKTGVTR